MHFGLSESVSHWAKYRSNSAAVLSNGESINYRRFNFLVNRIGESILDSGMSGGRIAVACKEKLMSLASYVAITRLGLSVVVLHPSLPQESISTSIRDTGAIGLVYDEGHASILELAENNGVETTLNLQSVEEKETVNSRIPKKRCWSEPADEWGVLFSSGTTGVPKGIERDHYSIMIELVGWCLELGLNETTTFYIGRPVYYTGGLVLTAATLVVGGTVVLNDYHDDNDPEEVWNDYQGFLEKGNADWAFFVPTQLRSFVRIAQDVQSVQSARAVLSMGEPISAEDKGSVAAQLGTQVVESWGNTESLGTITKPEDLSIRPDSIGRPFLTDELYIVGESEEKLGPGELGRLAGGDEASFAGYSSRDDETDRTKREGMIISEDYGYMDEDGYFYIRGRSQDLVVIDGESFFIPQLEDKLRNKSLVSGLAISRKEEESEGTGLVAVVVVSEGKSDEEHAVLRRLNEALDSPISLEGVVIVDSLPLLPSGKLDRMALKDLIK